MGVVVREGTKKYMKVCILFFFLGIESEEERVG